MDPRACDGWTTVRPLWLLGPPFCRFPLAAGPVEFHDFELIRIDAVEAAHVQHDHLAAAGTLAEGIRLNAAGLAERVMNSVRVKFVVRHLVFPRQQLEIGHRSRRQEGAKFPTSRAIARDHLADVGLHFVADFPALAAAGVGLLHCALQSLPVLNGREMRRCCAQYDISSSRQRSFASLPNGAVSILPVAGAAFFPSSSKR